MVTLLCPVRGCGLPLSRNASSVVCERRHSFDLSRSGYINLLQSHAKRSSRPGDAPDAIAARRRFLERGYERHVVDAIVAEIAALDRGVGSALLDVGCGTGYFVGEIANALAVECHGVDISSAAVDIAAKAHPACSWVVANADRFLPFKDASFQVVLSITARRNGSEFHRVLSPSGALVVVIPAGDDLVELREAVLGQRVVESRVDRVVEELEEHFSLGRRSSVSRRVSLDAESARDALAATYRGARASQRDRVARLEGLSVTLARDLLVFLPRRRV